MTETIPQLSFELSEDGGVRLQNEHCGDDWDIYLHPTQFRYLAEKAGLTRKASANDADLMRTVVKLKRDLPMLRDRCEELHQNIYMLSQLGREELGIEVAQSAALMDMLEMICTDLGDFVPRSD